VFPNADIPLFWPISEFTFRIPTFFKIPDFLNQEIYSHCQLSNISMIFVFAYFFIFYIILKKIESFNSPLSIYLIGIGSILLSNLIQGFENGIIDPVNGGGISGVQYYHDAVKLDGAIIFLNDYNNIQASLLTHSCTHPPGAVLVYYYLNYIYPNPVFTSITLMSVSLLSVFYLYKLVSVYYNKEIAQIISFIFIFLPAVQIYYLSSLDGLISFIFLGLIYHYFTYAENQKLVNFIPLGIYLFLLSSLTYFVVFAIGVIIFDLLRNRDFKVMIEVSFLLLGIYIFYLTFNFDYISGFITSTNLENPNGFRLLADPVSYFTTRLENIAEILLFFGPISIIIASKGLKYKANELVKLSCTTLLLLVLFFMSGAAKTGETARCCLLIYPFLLVFVANYVYNNNFGIIEKRKYLAALWLQSVVMQIFGYYFW
jgi:hypothetical protein